jgi:hypothetical protein
LAEILFAKLGIPVKKKTPSGTPSTDEEVLSELALDYPLPKILLESRQLAKLKSTYTDKLPKMVNAETGRVHTSYAQAVAVTGRLASSDPNLQNIPVRTAEGRRIRAAFIAPPGSRIVSADYSQIELRIMAHLSQDARLLQAFAQGRGRASGNRRRDLRRRTGGSRSRSAARRQGHQLRPDLRHERFRPRPPARPRAWRRPGLHRPLLCSLPRRRDVHDANARDGQASGPRGHRVRDVASGCPRSVPARPPVARAPNGRRSTPRCRVRRPI